MKLYELKNVRKFYSGQLALDIPSLILEQNNLYVVYGPNAAGKTTLLNLLAFLDEQSEGEIIFFNKCPQKNIIRRKATLLMQNPYLFKATVLKNVISGLTIRSLSRATAREIAAPIMKRLGIWELRNKNISLLSGGERKKVALARAIALNTEVLLLDEPTSHIDKTSAELIENMISTMGKNGKKTVIMTTHDISQAHRLTSSIIYLINGQIKNTPLWNVFAVSLNGSVDAPPDKNFISHGVKMAVIGDKTEIYVATQREGPAKIVIDPRDIIVSRNSFSSSALNNFKARIVSVNEVNGLVDLIVDAGAKLHAFITHRSFHEMELSIGNEVFVTFKASAVEVFDA